MSQRVPNHRALKGELIVRGLTQLELARRLGVPYSTLSSWLRRVAPTPIDLASRIEDALDMQRGSLVLVEANDG